MAYDVNTGVPLVSRIYEGASNDKVSVKDFVDQMEMKDMLFIVDRGFFSNDKKTDAFSIKSQNITKKPFYPTPEFVSWMCHLLPVCDVLSGEC